MTRRFVVEADGGSRGNPGPAGYGALVRDADTHEVLARTAEYIGVASNNVAEYSGLIAGLGLAVALDPGCRVEVRMDSKLVVEQMSGRWKIKHEDMRRLAVRARAVVDPVQVRYTWIPREQNKDADRLANEAMDDGARGWRGAQPLPAALGDPTDQERVNQPVTQHEGEAPQLPLSLSEGDARTGQPRADTGEPTTLVLLRHGVTEHTTERRFSGTGGSDLPLTALGREQAAAAATALRAAGGVDAVVSSPLLRCRQTAEVVARELGLEVRVDEGWTECAFGSWDGLTLDEVRERWSEEHRAWLGSPAVAPPGGESLDDVDRRVRVARERLMARHPRRRVLVVTHVGPIKSLVRTALAAGPDVVWRLDSSPASLTTVRWWTDGGTSVAAFNETGHLHAAGLALR